MCAYRVKGWVGAHSVKGGGEINCGKKRSCIAEGKTNTFEIDTLIQYFGLTGIGLEIYVTLFLLLILPVPQAQIQIFWGSHTAPVFILQYYPPLESAAAVGCLVDDFQYFQCHFDSLPGSVVIPPLLACAGCWSGGHRTVLLRPFPPLWGDWCSARIAVGGAFHAIFIWKLEPTSEIILLRWSSLGFLQSGSHRWLMKNHQPIFCLASLLRIYIIKHRFLFNDKLAQRQM